MLNHYTRWSIAFIIAAAIPDYFGFVSVISSATLLEFTYCFPPMLALAYDIQLHAIGKGEGFDPHTGSVIRHDRGLKRWIRGFFRGQWWLNIFHVLYSIGAWATAGLGLYAAIKGMYAHVLHSGASCFILQKFDTKLTGRC